MGLWRRKGTGVSIQHSYSQFGAYTLTLIIADDDGATDTANTTKIVQEQPSPQSSVKPLTAFTKSAETVFIGESIQFDASHSSDPDGTILSYLWNFGDETNETAVMPTHVYNEDGNYAVTPTVTDVDEAFASKKCF